MLETIKKKYNEFASKRNKLDMFLIKGSVLALAYFSLRILLKSTSFLKPIFIWVKTILISLLLNASNWILSTLGFDSGIFEKVVYIEGSQGVRIINACIGWSFMALYAGFIVAYPGIRKSKYWFIPLGIIIIIFFNIIRISLMAIISYKSPDSLNFYHRYIFNFIMYAVVFILWLVWVIKFREKREKIR